MYFGLHLVSFYITVCFRKVHASARIVHIQVLLVLYGHQIHMALSFFVTDNAITMVTPLKAVWEPKFIGIGSFYFLG